MVEGMKREKPLPDAAHTEHALVNPERPDPKWIRRAAEIIRAGGLVAFPTETVYGLGADALNPEAVRGIFEAKGRPATNPLIVHVEGAEEARRLVLRWPEAAERLARRFWPGPLTLILEKARCVPGIVTAGGPTVAIRAPSHPVARALIRAARTPIAAPSANRSMRLSPTRAEHVIEQLGGRVALVLDGGPTPGGIESTVLDLASETPRVLRPGPIAPSALDVALGRRMSAAAGKDKSGHSADLPESEPGAVRSPGLMARHYAPRTPLECIEPEPLDGIPRGTAGAGKDKAHKERAAGEPPPGWARVRELLAQGKRVGWLVIGSDALAAAGGFFAGICEHSPSNLICMALPADARQCEAELYASLHRLDAEGLDCIVAAMPPEGEAWIAVRDRLRRASAPPSSATQNQ